MEITARLHSKYQPQLEADRYIKTINPSRDIQYYILIEPGQCYLIPALEKICPDSKPVVLHADNVFRETESRYPHVPMWFPDSKKSVQEFLEECIVPEGASVRVIEWRPGVHAYGDAYLNLVRESAEFIKRSEASRRTGAAFGRRWVRNFFRNITLLNTVLQYRVMETPIVITGSGPSLEAALPEIAAGRDGVFILAASSSLPALAACGIMPDMVISTDGGGWALLHLHACFRTGAETAQPKIAGSKLAAPVKLAFALSAAVPSQCSALPLLPLNDGSLWQNIALHSLGIPSALIPQRGTVTASALELALILGSGTIFLAGMDFAVSDIQSHARPYGFDHLLSGKASRFSPAYSQCFMRSNDMRAGGSHDVYAAWFKNRIAAGNLAALPRRIFSIGGNHAVLTDNLPSGDLPRTTSAPQTLPVFKTVTLTVSPAERRDRAVEALTAALGKSEYAAALCGELAPLLFPSRSGISPGEIAETLRTCHG